MFVSEMARSWISLLLLCLVAWQVDGRGVGGHGGGFGRRGSGGGSSLFPGVLEPWSTILLVLMILSAFCCCGCILNCCSRALGVDPDDLPSRSEIRDRKSAERRRRWGTDVETCELTWMQTKIKQMLNPMQWGEGKRQEWSGSQRPQEKKLALWKILI